MKASEKIIITITSWYKRINNVVPVLNTIYQQTLPPDEIIINLCNEDFPNLEEDLPEDLIHLLEEHQDTHIYWYIENYKAWKKHLHAIEVASGDDIIISIDDDHLYPSDFIEKMYVSFCYYNKEHPVTLNMSHLIHNMWCFNGPGMLYQKKHLGKDYKKYLTHDILYNTIDDVFLSVLFPKNGAVVLPILYEFPEDKELLFNDIFPYTDAGSIIRNYDLTSVDKNTKLQEIRDAGTSTLANVANVFKDKFFSTYTYKSGELPCRPVFWKFFIDVLKTLHTKKTLYPGEQTIADAFAEQGLSANVKITPEIKIKNHLAISRPSKSSCIGEGNKLIITLASWNKRIENCYEVLNSMLYQTILPDEIILNLAYNDFNVINRDTDALTIAKDLVNTGVFPENLYNLILANPIIKIIWHEDEKLCSWKKYTYVATHYEPNDVIITIDDDVLYKETFIETMIKSYKEYGKVHPVTYCRNICQGGFGVCGFAFLFTPKFITFNKDMYSPEILHMFPEDNHLLNVINFNGYPAMPVIGCNYLFKTLNYNQGDSNFGTLLFNEDWWKSYYILIDESAKIITKMSEGREELKANWTPVYFNFNIFNLHKFIDSTNRDDLSYPVQCVYDYVKEYLETCPGQTTAEAPLAEKIDHYIL